MVGLVKSVARRRSPSFFVAALVKSSLRVCSAACLNFTLPVCSNMALRFLMGVWYSTILVATFFGVGSLALAVENTCTSDADCEQSGRSKSMAFCGLWGSGILAVLSTIGTVILKKVGHSVNYVKLYSHRHVPDQHREEFAVGLLLARPCVCRRCP